MCTVTNLITEPYIYHSTEAMIDLNIKGSERPSNLKFNFNSHSKYMKKAACPLPWQKKTSHGKYRMKVP